MSTVARLLSHEQALCSACTAMLSRRLQREAPASVRRLASLSITEDSAQLYHASRQNSSALASARSTNNVRSSMHAKSHMRHFSTSRKASFVPFFGFNRSKDDPQQLGQKFVAALDAEDPEKVVSTWRALRKATLADSSEELANILDVEAVSRAMKLLSFSSFINDDYKAVKQMFEDLATLFRVPSQSSEDYTFLLRAQVQNGRLRTALKTLRNAARKSVWTPATSDWNMYLQGLRASRPGFEGYGACKDFVVAHKDHVSWDSSTYLVLLDSLVALARTHSASHFIQEELEWLRAAFNAAVPSQSEQRAFDAHVAHYHIAVGDLEAAAAILQTWKVDQESETTSPTLCAAAARYEANIGNTRRSTELPQRVDPNDQSQSTLASWLIEDFLRSIPSSQDGYRLQDLQQSLARVEQACGMLPDHNAYQVAIQLSTSFEDAMQLYHDSQKDGIAASSGMVRAIAGKVPAVATADPTEALKRLYEDLARSRLTEERHADGGHDLAVFIVLLNYCAREDVRDIDWAISLMEDMKALGIAPLSSDECSTGPHMTSDASSLSVISTSAASAIVTRLMTNAARNHTEAFKPYSWMWALDSDNIFSQQDWHDIVRTYADLDFRNTFEGDSSSHVPASVFFAFFEDMRVSGTPPASPVYQAVLQYYARQGNSSASNAEAVRQIHDYIKMDQYHDPDIGLMNRLMYAYGKTGSLQSALGVWRSILINRIPFNNVSVSIILDTYGYLDMFPQAQTLWNNLKLQKFNLNKKNLESFIEAACRCGNATDAVEELFEHLRGQGESLVDSETVNILRKFVRSDSQEYYALKERIERQAPHLWRSRKQSIEVPKDTSEDRERDSTTNEAAESPEMPGKIALQRG